MRQSMLVRRFACRKALLAGARAGLVTCLVTGMVTGVVAMATLVTGGPAALAAPAPAAGTRFDPMSVTFVTLSTGWALGAVPCARSGECLALRQTTDAGRNWSARPLPAALLAEADRKVAGVVAFAVGQCCGSGLNVRFADRRDGWVYGGLTGPASQPMTESLQPTLWSTHDGGSTWQQQHLFPKLVNDFPVFDLEAAAGHVYAMVPYETAGAIIESSPVNADHWRVSSLTALSGPAGGSQPSGGIVLQGTSGWAVYGNDRGVDGSARLDSQGQWASWSPPCASVGNSFALPAASTSKDLVAVCSMGGFAYPLPKSAPPGAIWGSSWLYFSDNGGKTFQAGPELGAKGSFGDVLASPSPGIIVVSRDYENAGLEASFDGGHHWAVVYRGSLFYLGFTSPTQGVGLVQSSSTTTSMIMTFDGGRHWSPVTF